VANKPSKVNKQPQLPALPEQMLPALSRLTKALGIPREVLAPDEEITYAWRDLPRELAVIPPNLCGELIARMCVAVSTGLFDGAINYIWNATILHLREIVRKFGLPVVAQTLQKDFEEGDLIDLQDGELLDLCLKLGLISEDGFFFLDQCRDTRNNFSAAHPTIGKINDREFITFLNRCTRYALSPEAFPKGVDVGEFISAVKGTRFNQAQLAIWIERLDGTHDAQRRLLFGTAHGIYCDPDISEPGRLNTLDLCAAYVPKFTAGIRSDLVDRHSDYVAKGNPQKHTASQQFFEKLSLLHLLNESERHGVVSHAVSRLWTAHQGINNFYNEPPFAERLSKISEQGAIPETIQGQYVQTVVGCYIGNGYGTSRGAKPYYEAMIRGFSPREIGEMIVLPSANTIVGNRFQAGSLFRQNFVNALRLVDRASVPSGYQAKYDQLIKQRRR